MDEREQLERAMEAIEAQRETLGDAVVDTALAAFRQRLAAGSAEYQRSQVTALLTSACDFSGLAVNLTPHELEDLSAQLQLRLQEIIARTGGVIEHPAISPGAQLPTSRAMVALFDAGPAPDNAPERAVRAALEMLDETRRFCALQDLNQMHLRAGVCTGAALSDTVEMAGRLQEAAEPGEVLLSGSTYQAVCDLFDPQSLEPLQIQGPDGPLQVYRARSARPRSLYLAGSGEPGLTLPPAALVGRETELGCLRTALQSAAAERGVRSVTLVSEPGLGKTRLLQEFRSALDRENQPYILFHARGGWQRNPIPYALLRELLSFRFKILEADSPAVVQEKLLQGVSHWLGAEGVETAHWIAHLIGCEFAHSRYLNGRLDDPRRARLLAFQALNRFLALAAQQAPLLVLIDDLQWADEGSMDWIDTLARSEPGAPVLVVCAARPQLFERRPTWSERWPGHTRLDLPPLTPDQSGALAAQLLHAGLDSLRAEKTTSTAPTVPLRRIIERAEGNPYFIQELVQTCLESSTVTQPGVDAPSARVPGWLPASLVEALQARLDGLPPAEREVLLHAAVVGPVFWEAAVHSLLETGLSEGGEADLLQALDLPGSLQSLQQRGLINKHESSAFEHSEEYIFDNALLYEAVYESQQARRRSQDHARVAAWLAAQSSDRVEAYTAAIARHYERAGDWLQASNWFGLAALQARRTSAPEAAVRFFTRALELLPDEPGQFNQRVHLYKGLWDVQWWQARYADALATGQSLLAAAEAHQDLGFQAAAWNRIAAIQNRQGEYQPALRSVQRAERLARAGGAAREVVLALFNRGVTLFRMGDSAAALEAGEQALAFNQSLANASADVTAAAETDQAARLASTAHKESETTDSDASRETARILNLLAMINQRAGRYAQAESDYRHVLTLQRERGDRPATVSALNNLGLNAQLQGNYQAAARHYQEALQLTQELGYYDLELVCLNYLAGAQVELGEYGLAEAALQEVLRRTEGSGWFLQGEVYRFLALANLGQGRRDAALQAGLHALELAQKSHANEHIGRAWRVLGQVAAAEDGAPVEINGQGYSAHACYAASLQVFVEIGAAGEQARTVRDWARYELQHGDRREGIRLWQEARDLFSRLALAVEVQRMDQLAGMREAAPDE